MKRVFFVACLIALLAAAAVGGARLFRPASAAVSTGQIEGCIAAFDIEPGPRLVLLPVTVNGRTVSFCVDTGSSMTVFDSSLQSELGHAQGTSAVMTPSGPMSLPVFDCPPASVAALDLTSVGSVACHDLTKLRYASGKEIYGVLGMDFLRNYALDIDFDNGKCRLWKAAPKEWNEPANSAPVASDEWGRPCVTLMLPDGRSESFLIDTGANVSTLRDVPFDELYQQGHLTVAGNASAYAAAGMCDGQVGYISTLTLNTFTHQGLRLDRDPFSALGIRYLSRYNIRLDNANRVAYFIPSKRFSAAEPTATSGLSVLQINGEKVVCSVDRGGPAAAHDIEPGDVILSVDGRDATNCDMTALHEILTREAGTSVVLRLRRSGYAFDTAIELQNRLPSYR